MTIAILTDIPNFKWVDQPNCIGRSGQPQNEDQFQALWKAGFGRILTLDTESEGADSDLSIATKLGFQVMFCPIPWQQQVLLGADLQEVVDALDFITYGTLVHCKNGWDRTGFIVGLYRIKQDHWTEQQAWEEMIADGFHPELVGLDITFLKEARALLNGS